MVVAEDRREGIATEVEAECWETPERGRTLEAVDSWGRVAVGWVEVEEEDEWAEEWERDCRRRIVRVCAVEWALGSGALIFGDLSLLRLEVEAIFPCSSLDLTLREK